MTGTGDGQWAFPDEVEFATKAGQAQHMVQRAVDAGAHGPANTNTGSRWQIEECFQQAKNEAGLDQVRTWRAWYAHITPLDAGPGLAGRQPGPGRKGEPLPAARA